MSDTLYNLSQFKAGDRVWAFHPQTLGVLHWATVTKVGRKHLTVTWHVTDRSGRVLVADVVSLERV